MTMKFSSTIVSLILLLVCLAPNSVTAEQEGSVATLRRLRALGSSGGYHFGGDNGRDHPQNYPKPSPTMDVTSQVSDATSLCACACVRVHALPI